MSMPDMLSVSPLYPRYTADRPGMPANWLDRWDVVLSLDMFDSAMPFSHCAEEALEEIVRLRAESQREPMVLELQ